MSYISKLLSCSLILTLIACVGCNAGKSVGKKVASWDVRRAVGLKSDKPEPSQVPDSMVTSWVNAVLSKPGTEAKRGFGGRITFFGEDGETPVRVDGQLAVYAFDESLGDPEVIHPTRRYVFPQDQFEMHESETNLGPSYSVWLPWDAVGGEKKNISLIARFEPHGGALLVGEQTRHLLPGTSLASKKPKDDEPQATNGVQLAQHAKPEGTSSLATQAVATQLVEKPKKKLTSTSIPLSKSWQERLLKQSKQPAADANKSK